MQVIDKVFFKEDGSLDCKFDGETIEDVIKWLSGFPQDAVFCQEFDYDSTTTRIVYLRNETVEETSVRERKECLIAELEYCLAEIGKTIPERHHIVIHYTGSDYKEKLIAMESKLEQLREKEKQLKAELGRYG